MFNVLVILLSSISIMMIPISTTPNPLFTSPDQHWSHCYTFVSVYEKSLNGTEMFAEVLCFQL